MGAALKTTRAVGKRKTIAVPGVQRWSQLYTCAKALAVVQHCRQQRKPGLCIATDMRAACSWQKELRFFAPPALPVFLFPDWNLLPYDRLSPPADIVAERMAARQKLSAPQFGICVTTINALLQRQVSPRYAQQHCLLLKKGERHGLNALRHRLVAMAYENSPQVDSVGQFAVRGSLIDLWSPSCDRPVRVDFFDDEIDSLRCFDVSKQTSIASIDSLLVLPLREFTINPTVIKSFRQRCQQQFGSAADTVSVYEQLSDNVVPTGIEYYLPYLLDDTSSLLDHLPSHTQLFYDSSTPERIEKLWDEIRERYLHAREENVWPPLPPEQHYFQSAEITQRMRSHACIELAAFATPDLSEQHPPPTASAAASAGQVLDPDHTEQRLAPAASAAASAGQVLDPDRSAHQHRPPASPNHSEQRLAPAASDRTEQRRPLASPAAPNHNGNHPLPLASPAASNHNGNHPLPLTTRRLPPLALQLNTHKPLSQLEHFVHHFQGRILFVAETLGYREQLLELLDQANIQVKVVNGWSAFLQHSATCCLCVGEISEGVILKDPALAIIADSQLLGQKTKQSRTALRAADTKYLIQNPEELALGCAIVHEEYGVGRFLGLQVDTELTGYPTEFLVLEYRDGDKIYVPVSALQLIRRYSGSDDQDPPLHKLGSKEWQKAKRKAAQKAYDVAAELLDTEARRQACKATVLRANQADYLLFSNQFAYQETPDQAQAIADITHDLQQTKPLDRIVCGDVGFGKTEVAMRAVFIAVHSGHQAVVLTPTTILANQHFQTFSSRFADWPVRLACLSRFCSARTQKRIEEELLNGTLDIVIGTHKLLHGNIRFKRLGLIVIDEEQRFGVRHKERLKAMQANCHTLTLTATPIPRTLSMSLSGLRELSIITTPPPRRRAIQTFVSEWDDKMIADACEREMQRGGQIYFIHNNIETIEETAEYLRELLPQADIRSAHGRMRKDMLGKITLHFYRRRFSILVCTTIIENGIDVPSANTIIVNQADRMGLSQLHQLRGRVGRSHHKAYAYFLLSHARGLLQDQALRRLEAIESLSDLGAGFSIAAQDLEVRGAGELLGKEQSGHIHAIGFSLYNDLLKRTIQALQSGHVPDVEHALNIASDIDLGEPALIPENYVPDANVRLILYRRIAAMENTDMLEALKMEIIDRFGLLPDYTKNLFACASLRLHCQALGIRRIDVREEQGSIVFHQQAAINTEALLNLIKKEPHRYHFRNSYRLNMQHHWSDVNARYQGVKNLLAAIAPSS